MTVSVQVIDQLRLVQGSLHLVEMASESLDDQDDAMALHVGISLVRQAIDDLRALLDPSGQFSVPSGSQGWH
ncbi:MULTISPECIES: hypothetical protein [unclassified Rhizobium]